MKNLSARYLAIVLLIYSIPVTALHGAEIQGHWYENEFAAGDKKLPLKGLALMRYWGFKAYTGALYVEENVSIGNVLADSAKRLELVYLRPIKGEDFGKATTHMVTKNVDADTFERLRPRMEFYNSLYEGVKPGDRYSLTYIPGRGTELALNGVPKGVIEGEDFAAAVFAIWLGPNPISDSFRDKLMGAR